MGFGMVRAHDGKRGEALAHHQPWASEHVALEDLVEELGGDDGNAGGRELNARHQEASADEARSLRDSVGLVAIGQQGPDGRQVSLGIDIANVVQFLKDCCSLRGEHGDDDVASGYGSLCVSAGLHGA